MSLCWEQFVAAMDEVVSHLVHFWGQRGQEMLALRFSVRRCDAGVLSSQLTFSNQHTLYDTLTCQFTVCHTDLLSSVCRTDGSCSHGGIMYVCYSDLSAEMMERPVSWGGLVYEGALILKNTPLSLHQISLCPALHPSPFLHLSGCFSFKLCTNLKFKEIIHSKKVLLFFLFLFLTHSVNACLKWMNILFWPYNYPHYLLTNLTIRLWSCNHTQWKTRPLRLGRHLWEADNHC